MRRPLLSRNEEGVVLVLCLITLVLLTLIGVSATTTSQLEAEISGNDKTYKEAFYAAEVALTAGETVVNSMLSRMDLNKETTPGYYDKNTQSAWDKLAWDNEHTGVVDPIPNGLSKVSDQPRYTIEEKRFRRNSLVLGPDASTGTYLFTVKSQGTGTSKTAHVVLESIYAKQYN
jgi:type IV pilus assembly protein PilX